jgi:hypothetical protein
VFTNPADLYTGHHLPRPHDRGSSIVLRLGDGSFVQASFHIHGDVEVNPIASTDTFAHFQENHADRRMGDVHQQMTTSVNRIVALSMAKKHTLPPGDTRVGDGREGPPRDL